MPTILDSIIGYASPILGAAIAGPAGAAVTSLIASAFGGNAANLEDLAQKIKSDPEAEIKLKQIEEQVKALSVQRYTAMLSDTQDARKRDVEIITDKVSNPFVLGFIALMPHFLTLIVACGLLVIILCLFFIKTDINDQPLLNMLLGQMVAVFIGQCKFYYGDSKRFS